MKIIEEGLKNGLLTPDGLFQSIYGRGECNKRKFLLSDYKKIPREERKDVIACLARLDMLQPVEGFLQSVRFAISHDNSFDIGDKSDVDVRQNLVEELLSWTEVGVQFSPATMFGAQRLSLLYMTVFDLIYYHSSHQRHVLLENFHSYGLKLRRAVIEGLLEYEESYLEKYAYVSITEINRFNRRYYKMFGGDPHSVWAKEIQLFVEMGLSIDCLERDLKQFIHLYCAQENANALCSLFQTTGLKMSPFMAKKCKEIIERYPYKKEHTREMFIQCIDRYTEKRPFYA